MIIRKARVSIPDHKTGAEFAETVKRYLPSNYRVSEIVISNPSYLVIEGTDNAGWTLDGYVIPRLASGMYFAKEIIS